MLSINYTRLPREIDLEIQLTKIEKLADSFRLARFTLADSLICSSNPWQTVLTFRILIHPCTFEPEIWSLLKDQESMELNTSGEVNRINPLRKFRG